MKKTNKILATVAWLFLVVLPLIFFIGEIAKEVEHLRSSEMYSQAESMASSTCAIANYYLEQKSLPIVWNKTSLAEVQKGGGEPLLKDIWKNPYVLSLTEEKDSLLLRSYGSDKKIGGAGNGADWSYEINISQAGVFHIRILESPVPQVASNKLDARLSSWKGLNPIVEIVGSERSRTKNAENPCSSLKSFGDWMVQLYQEYGIVGYSVCTLLAIGWFWYWAVFRDKTKYLVLVVLLCFPLILVLGSLAGGVFGPLGFATVILKADRTRTSRNRYFRDYLAFFFAMIFLAIISGLII